jgi:hypothetical protein
MKANELRVGNLVKNQYDEKSIVIRGYDINDLCEGMDSEVFQPIFITKEWLEKFGFEKEKYSNLTNIFFRLKVLSHGTISFYPKEEGFNIDLGTTSGYHFGTTKIEYIHQLQNLYFAITGTELAYETEIEP